MAEKQNCGYADVHVLYTPSCTLRPTSDSALISQNACVCVCACVRVRVCVCVAV